ncbi:MAG: hypothetical protein ABI346_09410 [Candidatus Baltobacteraceae bacterium]
MPIALPASAAQIFTSRLPIGARESRTSAKGNTPAAVYRKLVARLRRKPQVGHFAAPFGLATDVRGNLYVTNFESNSIAIVNPRYHVRDNVITQGVESPVSVAVGPLGNVYVGNLTQSSGYVTEYSGSTPLLTIEAYTGDPDSIAVDSFGDLYVTASSGIATDDPYGSPLFGPAYASYNVLSVAVGNAGLNGFYNNGALIGNGSVFLRTGSLQFGIGPTSSATPTGSACANNACWYDDTSNLLIAKEQNGGTYLVSVSYEPTGVAYDGLRNRLFVADPNHNAIHVYNAQTLAFETTIS